MSVLLAKDSSTKLSQNSKRTTWGSLLFWKSSRFQMIQKIMKDYPEGVTPDPSLIFRPLIQTKPDEVKVVFLMPEAHYTEGDANGLALSYNSKKPFKKDSRPWIFDDMMGELKRDQNIVCKRGDLSRWTKQGVLLWNARPTTLTGHVGGHLQLGWEYLTAEILETVYLENSKCVFVHILNTRHEDLLPKDSIQIHLPCRVGAKVFEGTEIFSKVNSILRETDQRMIDWRV